MKKSIEEVWKEGFINHDEELIPKFVNLYNRKSIHLISRLKSTMKSSNQTSVLIAIMLFTAYMFYGRTLLGVVVLLASGIAFHAGRKQLASLEKIDFGNNAYEYLKTFEAWWKSTVFEYSRLIKYALPTFILLTMLIEVYLLYRNQPVRFRQIMNDEVSILIGIGAIALILISWLVSTHVYKKVINTIYGHELMKLRQMIAEMEELRSSNN